jgi:hypothetical protein
VSDIGAIEVTGTTPPVTVDVSLGNQGAVTVDVSLGNQGAASITTAAQAGADAGVGAVHTPSVLLSALAVEPGRGEPPGMGNR